jgi:hypothetical protein
VGSGGVFGVVGHNPKPIGAAHEIGSYDDGQAAWSLIVRGVAVSGRIVISNREFKLISR